MQVSNSKIVAILLSKTFILIFKFQIPIFELNRFHKSGLLTFFFKSDI